MFKGAFDEPGIGKLGLLREPNFFLTSNGLKGNVLFLMPDDPLTPVDDPPTDEPISGLLSKLLFKPELKPPTLAPP